MKTKILILIALLANTVCGLAQDERQCSDYDFSPQAFKMITEGNINPDLNTGTLHLSVPIYTWSDPDFTIPFSLSYSTNGFVPARPAGAVGLGWSINVGGCISRQIYGKDDFTTGTIDDSVLGRKNLQGVEEEEIYTLGDRIYYQPSTSTLPLVRNNSDRYLETQADVFHFNFFGHSGSFVFNTSGGVTVFDSNGASGTYSVEYDFPGFSITTDDGYVYHFGSVGSSQENLYDLNTLYYMKGGHDVPSLNGRQKITTWLLDKVIAPNGRLVTFTYMTEGTGYAIPTSNSTVSTTFGQGSYRITNNIGGEIVVNKHASITTMPHVSEIRIKESDSYSDQGTIIAQFSYSPKSYKETDQNDDISCVALVPIHKKLDSVDIYGHDGQPVSGASLSYSYKDTRMLLDSVYVRNVGKYTFGYDKSNFMPGILTNAIDHWGYYNGKTGNDDTDIDPTSMNVYYDETIAKDFKDPDADYSVTGTLSSITYPTGGRTDFEYEGNTADRILLRTHLTMNPDGSMHDPFIPILGYYYPEFSDIEECGGVRIKSITDHYDEDNSFTRTFSYNAPGTNESSGIVLKFKRYALCSDYGIAVYSNRGCFPDNSLDRSHVAYSHVTEHYPDGSYIVHSFTDYKDYPDEFSQHNLPTAFIYENDPDKLNLLRNIYREPDSRDYRRGKLKKTEYYDSSDSLKREMEYEYEDSGDDYTAYVIESGGYLWSARRFLCDFRLKRQIETIHENGRSVKTINTLTYNSLGQVVRQSVTDESGLNGDIICMRYCHESPGKDAPSGILGILSDKLNIKLRNGTRYLTSSTEYTYKISDKNTNPTSKVEYLIDTPVSLPSDITAGSLYGIGRGSESWITTYTYNPLYRLTGTAYPGGAYIAYTWDESGNYIIGKTINDPSQSYEYDWLDMVGPMRAGFPDGTWQTYRYDENHRLKIVNDHLNNPVTRYEYFIKNQ